MVLGLLDCVNGEWIWQISYMNQDQLRFFQGVLNTLTIFIVPFLDNLKQNKMS